ncbi:MAG: ATP-dependent zinc metalloprotease FtsH [Calditrichaeota bacterium]|nr:ATP-dependent zinc metalloprotease FtsH [Calditrichota bacterium]
MTQQTFGTEDRINLGSYRELVKYVDKGVVEKLEYYTAVDGKPAVFKGKFKEQQTFEDSRGKGKPYSYFYVNWPAGSQADFDHISEKVEIRVLNHEGEFMDFLINFLPWIFIIAVFIMFTRRMQGTMSGGSRGGGGIFSIGKSKATMLSKDEIKTTFGDVAGADEAKYELEEVIDFLKYPSKYQKLGGKIPKGVLLTGAPGTGKTLLARAVAGEAGVPFFSLSGSDFVEMFVGVGASRVRDLFEQGRKNAPCIIFIDEIDAVGRQRGIGLGGGNDEREQTLNALLVEMDGFDAKEGVIIMAATNRPDVLDSALMRPGRFDRRVVVDRPDIIGREGILKVHTKKVPLADDVDLKQVAIGTPGFVGADLANLVNEAALLAARYNKSKVEMDDFESAKDKVILGLERKSLLMKEDEKKATAYHEAGHTILGKLLPEQDPVYKVTIIPRGFALGVTWSMPKDDVVTQSKKFLEGKLAMLMGGRVAEKIIFGHISSGAGNDIEQATNIARRMVCEFGMSEKIGPVSFKDNSNESFTKAFSEQTASDIDNEVKALVLKAEKTAEKILKENVEILKVMANELFKRETLLAHEIDTIIKGEKLPDFVKKIQRTDKDRLKEIEKAKNAVADDAEEETGLEGGEVPAV